MTVFFSFIVNFHLFTRVAYSPMQLVVPSAVRNAVRIT